MADALSLAFFIPLIPLLGAAVVAAIGHRTPERGGWITLLAVGAAGLISVLSAVAIWTGTNSYEEPFVDTVKDRVGHAWLEAGEFAFDLGVYIDPLTALLLLVVGITTTGIALYGIGYMRSERDGYHVDGTHIAVDGRRRYHACIALFVAGMLGFVVGSNLVMMFVFWEIMGLCSYLLIGYWYARPSAAAAAKKAFLVTRIGDVFFLLGLIIIAVLFQSLDLRDILDAANIERVAAENHTLLGVATLCLFGGAVGKSAQFPLHVWLPDAMEGPTTVSALIHAATMVKAGVFLVARFFPLFHETVWVLYVVAGVGALTAVMAATMATVNNDLKRVLAYSTISQLAYMFLGLGAAAIVVEAFTPGMFHLFNHAFFKALLFLGAGAVGHALHSYDMRRMGGLRKHMPLTSTVMLIGTLAIAGVPPFSGFWSKDELLATVYEAGGHDPFFLVLYAVGLITAALTAYYMLRLWLMTFAGSPRDEHVGHAHDGHWTMNVVLSVLAVFAVIGGFFIFRVGDFVYFEEPFHFSLGHMLGAPTTYLGLAAAGAGLFWAWKTHGPANVSRAIKADDAYTGYAKVLQERYYFDHAYDWFARRVVVGAAFVTDAFDRRVIDSLVDAVGTLNSRAGATLRRLHSGRVQDYAVALMGGALVLVLLLVYVVGLSAGQLEITPQELPAYTVRVLGGILVLLLVVVFTVGAIRGGEEA